MRQILTLLYFVFITTSFAQTEQIRIEPDSKYPRWLKTDSSRTDQTSGITFIKSVDGKKYFLLADDIGQIHNLIINGNEFEISTIEFSDSAKEFVDELPKADFEEIVYDKSTGSVYLSIEGNGRFFNKYVGIYKIHFSNTSLPYKVIQSFEKIEFTPKELFYKYTAPNIGYEGLAVDKNYFYLGLEGFVNGEDVFADSSLIFIANKTDRNIIKQISTKNLGIHTICGLFTDKEGSLWGIDRNQRKIFHINLDECFNVKKTELFDCSTQIPGYPELNYLPSMESITSDDEDNLYLVDDPWKKVYVPEQKILSKLDTVTIENYKEFIPIIFRYKIINN